MDQAKWQVIISGDIEDLDHISHSFTSPDFRLVRFENQYAIESSEFDPDGSADDIKAYGERLIEWLDGAMKLLRRSHKSLRFDRMALVRPDGNRTYFMYETGTMTIRASLLATMVNAEGNEVEIVHRYPVDKWFAVARKSPAVAKVLRLFSKAPRMWGDLYRIYEVIESDCGGLDNVVTNGWATRDAIRRFKHTANEASPLLRTVPRADFR